MELLELMKNRHSVRQYKEQPVEQEKRERINALIRELNADSGLSMQAFYEEPRCFQSFLAHYGKFEGVKNYVAIVGGREDQEKVGYYGEKLVLECQAMGLNTCWVAMTHGRSQAKVGKGQKLWIIIALGYGQNQGVPHKSKPIEELSRSDEAAPWFQSGMEAACLAPTAMNQQKFLFELRGGEVTVRSLGGFYSQMDLGIVRYHFEAVTGREVKICQTRKK